jgi:hypothetical protein
MARTYHHGKRNNGKRVRIRAVKRDKPDLKRLSRALISLAQAELEKEAEVLALAKQQSKKKKKRGRK